MMVATVLGTLACGKTAKPGEGGDKAAAAQPASEPTKEAPSGTPSAPAADLGFCEYTVDGGAPNRGGGGISNVQSIHFMIESQRGMGGQLLINCGAKDQISISAPPKTVPIEMGPKKHAIKNGGTDFSVLGPNFMGGTGEIDITAWDKAHVAGSFKFEAKGKQYAGTFDLKCPQPGNGVCTP